MKSSALHLVVILLVGSQLLVAAIVQTTTTKPPTLPSPQRSQFTTVMTPSTLPAVDANTSHENDQRSTARDQKTAVDSDESDEDETRINGHNTTARLEARGRSIGTGSSIQNDSQRRLYQRQRLPLTSPSVDAQQVQQHQFQRQSESSTGQAAVQQLQTTKTPRMIQRLVAGHIQNSPSIVNNTSERSSSTTSLYRRAPHQLSSIYRAPKFRHQQPLVTTTPKALTIATLEAEDREDDDDDDHDDAALLDDSSDNDNWDNGILRLSAGSGKETSQKTKKKSDAKKTLSDQVRDGKYGLIEKELFQREPRRPGVISYLPNKEVPIDNERNFGGLDEEDIWLAEDHLLVLKGGHLNEREPSEPWPPLDDYKAPGRQIKIPPNPKIPPPFPVQLDENGPIQFIGDSKVSIVYPIANESISIYSAGQEIPIETSEADRDHEKNLLTRPGATGSTEKGQNDPTHFYPKPYPPWLFHNQSFVNPFLNARPIPGIGPFLNGSLENYNGTDFDEDDPSLYYPPPYSFVYKSNYSNPVPPGPLVPGIVLPPPPDAFARLEKHRTKFPPPTTLTTTTTSTTEMPFRDILTKISGYTPKTIVVSTTKSSPRPISTTISPPPTVTTSQLQPGRNDAYYTVPPPPPPSKVYTTQKINSLSFVPTTPSPGRNTLTFSKSNPIYYEYFEARKEPSTTPNYIPEHLPNAPQQRPQYKPSKVYGKSKIVPNNQFYYTSTTTPRPPTKQLYTPSNRPQFVYEDYVYITPKPEIRPNGISNANHNFSPYQVPVKVPPLKNNRPYDSFEREVNAIRETLRFYQNQHLQDNNIPRTPKSKPIYEYSFEASKPTSRNFNPPTEYDDEPFKPMVTYSPPVDDANAFRAIAFEKVDNDLSPVQGYYETSTTVEPQPELSVRQKKKIRVQSAKFLQSLVTPYDQEQQISGRPVEYVPATTSRPILATQKPWVSVEKQVVQEVGVPVKMARLQTTNNRGFQGQFQGYYYNSPNRQNNRYYDEPFQQQHPTRKMINQRPPPRPQKQQQPIWSLENDTYVNYAPNRPPLNPEAEFLNPYQTFSQYSKLQMSQAQRLPPSQVQQVQQIQNINPYFPPPPPPIRVPIRQQQQQQQQPISLHRDTLVNYRQPLPPINPDSEYLSIPNRPQAQQQLSLPSYRPPVQYRDPSQGSNVYFITPKYRRYNDAENDH